MEKKFFFLPSGRKRRSRGKEPFFINRILGLSVSKRQRFVIAVVLLMFMLFISEYFFGKAGLYMAFFLSFLTGFLLLSTNYKDIRENFSPSLFILPFFYTLSFALFYFVVPARLLTRIIMTSLYGIGLYAVFLSQNIFTVAAIRTIALLASARTVSLVMTLVSFFFLTRSIFAFDFPLFPTAILIFILSFFLTTHALWTYGLTTSFFPQALWSLMLSVCIFELSLILWFWPADPTFISIFLTGYFYVSIGLSQAWQDKRLFKGVLWEYTWVGVIVFCILMLFTSWKG